MSTHLSCLGFVACDCCADAGGQAVHGECKKLSHLGLLMQLLLAPVRLHHYRRMHARAIDEVLRKSAATSRQPLEIAHE